MGGLHMGFFRRLGAQVLKAAASYNSFENIKNRAPNEIGVYIMSYKGRVVYVGRAIEDRPNQSTKGLRKRLQEHWRGAANGKRELYEHRDELTVSVRICQTVEEAKRLEGALIRQHDTVRNGWNDRYED